VSGGGIEFMRPWVEQVYGIPPEQTIGSSIKTQFEMKNGVPVLFRLAEADFVDDKAGKPVGINKFIGRRPIAAFGNSDGDQQCSNGRPAAAVPGSWCSSITLMRHVNSCTIAIPLSVRWTKRLMKRRDDRGSS
jgi:hypothetical protein